MVFSYLSRPDGHVPTAISYAKSCTYMLLTDGRDAVGKVFIGL